MVRGIVGTLVQVGRERLDSAQFGNIVAAADRRQGGANAPPHGLMLIKVDYPVAFEIERAGCAARPQDRPATIGGRIGSGGAAGTP